MFFSNLIFCISNIMGQRISADLQKTYQDKDSLIITLTLKNETSKPVFLICNIDELNFNDFIPISENYGSFRADVKARKKNQSVERKGSVKDTIKLVIPTTKERFIVDHKGVELDIFSVISNLQEIYSNKKVSFTVPAPPTDSVLFLDSELYKLIQNKNISVKEGYCSFCVQTIILQPYEEKDFKIDLGYLLLRKATYKILYDCKTDNNYLKKETKFLKSLGFQRFKGRIISNAIYIFSE